MCPHCSNSYSCYAFESYFAKVNRDHFSGVQGMLGAGASVWKVIDTLRVRIYFGLALSSVQSTY